MTTTANRPDPFLRATLDAIRTLLAQGDLDGAEQRCQQLLEKSPQQIEALNFLAMTQIRQGLPQRALQTLQQGLHHHPQDPLTLNSLAMLHQQLGDAAAALALFSQLLAVQPGNFVARLYRGALLEQTGQAQQALVAYTRALRDARNQGRWTSDETTAPLLRAPVLRAVQKVRSETRALFASTYAPLLARYGAAALSRVEHCLAAHLGEVAASSPDARQQPSFLYFPGLSAVPYLASSDFAGVRHLEEQTASIREELLKLLPSHEGRQRVFGSEEEEAQNLAGSHGAPSWNGYYFYRHGEAHVSNQAACPATTTALEKLPLARVPGHAPEVLFSVFAPGTHLLPHRGVTNTRVVGHLPLIIPKDCALNVAGQLHHWQEGKVVVFDDTYEHEAWNRSREIRVVMIFDLWHPHLTAVERLAVADLVVALGDFRQQTDRD